MSARTITVCDECGQVVYPDDHVTIDAKDFHGACAPEQELLFTHPEELLDMRPGGIVHVAKASVQ